MTDILLLVVSACLVNNVILTRFLGLCSFMGVTTRVDTAVGMGAACTFVITTSSMASWALEHWLLAPFGLGYLRTVTFILIIASAVQLTESFFRKFSPTLFRLLGIYLPLITTNCAVLGITLLLVEQHYGFVDSTVFAFASSVGYSLVMVLFAGLRERLALSVTPRLFEGPPIGFVTASLLALAFMGFSGMSVH
ncbi:electron transport complex RnfABCDGE type A subunit [Zymomonas mobilis subsp. mobilis ZM4 = ATCC 31821]|uniref:Ion-translocating oxidoreductase complex subunit A n=2 Tax=Zymomonas mobilis subsp. mobilis TaxID=120045 RepID=Q5NLH2_ZYMMO|nr:MULTISPECIES: electron transport complex subunit RsxA [Zymomonas]AAV90438.1 electron transport complex, RnfABCDGE type, A subunit [Zymomonas mobilis subsp. mobilis ZM4 = ATCC 31821]ACV75959.1 electron transport complex, RnfABCDGE type, A subunit [Zymomonas mobilis subsp. mobilis NCIMB 11163]AEH63163.1 electron transport complex, RnfABCDGE type, A subunit [Zymomonas mobilis subsp. mobilis ATCC 10988]AFN57186.1 electron transport complex, RnfABCDGE type, A subunit [Zymomonas mobilis subsp. mob